MTDKTAIDLVLLLPSVPNARDACVQRLNDLLIAKDGIERAHLVESKSNGTNQICIHYDPDRMSSGEVRDLANRAGAEIDQRYGHLLLNSETMYARRANVVESRAKQIPGVLDVAVSGSGLLSIEFDRQVTDPDSVRIGVRKLGVRLLDPESLTTPLGSEPTSTSPRQSQAAHDHAHGHDHAHSHSHAHLQSGLFGERTELVFAAASGAMLLGGWLMSFATNVTPWLPWSMYLIAYAFGGYFTFREAVESLRVGRFEIDFLMLVAAIGAATLGEWAEGALLLFLFSLGHALEHFAMGRAKRAIEALAELAPTTALVRRGEDTVDVNVEELQIGDIVIVKPNERIAADGFVTLGTGSVNQAPITGESMPVDKHPVDDVQAAAAAPDRLDVHCRVFAGTINNSDALEIQVTKLSTDSTLARVVQMVREAETQKSPTQRFTDTFERYFVPAVIVSVVLLLFAWIVIDETIGNSFYRAMAVLVASSPCALAISTPSAVLSGVARAARGGVLVKGGAPLENLGRLTAIAFDKTGTLTEGKPRLTDVIVAEGVSETELLQVAVAVESLSDHPLAAAVVAGAKMRLLDQPVPQAMDVQSITGLGVTANIDGEKVLIGNERLILQERATLPDALHKSFEILKKSGRTTMIVLRGKKLLGVLGVMDTPRASAKQVINRLRELGVQRVIMLSGDNQQVATAVANEVGISEAWGELMPEAKVDAIKKLNQQGGVAMIGDGVNDAPAMANATVGIAMGAAGSDVALETADVALMADDLTHLPFAVGLSRQTSRIIVQNLWISLGMVAFLVPATIVGLRLGPAVFLHEGSTLLVVVNALRLLAYKAK